MYWALQGNEEQGGLWSEEQGLDTSLEELRSPTEDNLLPFADPSSPQSQALAWLRDDPITLTPGRTFETALERYVLAVLYFTTSGPARVGFFLNDTGHCTWNALTANIQYVHKSDHGTLPTNIGLLSYLQEAELQSTSSTWSVNETTYQACPFCGQIVVRWNAHAAPFAVTTTRWIASIYVGRQR